MVSKENKRKMADFIASRLEDSNLYNIIKKDNSHLLVAEKPDINDNPQSIVIINHNYKRTFNELKEMQSKNRDNWIYTAHLFYKDGENFMVRLGKRGHFKGDERSLKNYTKEERDAMLHLRDLEKAVLNSGYPELSYYQPETDRLSESIRIFKMKDVELDYSHIKRGDAGYGFVKDSLSVDYKLPEEIMSIVSEPASLLLVMPQYRRALIRLKK